MIAIANSVRDGVRPCTKEMWHAATHSQNVRRTCAEIAAALERVKRGELSRSTFNDLKTQLKKQLPIITPHALFPSGRRRITDAVPTGLSMYDVDHIADPLTYYCDHVDGREAELGICLAHITPSAEGLRLVFEIPSEIIARHGGLAHAGNALAEAQQWMSHQLGNEEFDECCKDLARCSFVVPRGVYHLRR